MYKVTPQLYASAMWPLYCAFCADGVTGMLSTFEVQLRFGLEGSVYTHHETKSACELNSYCRNVCRRLQISCDNVIESAKGQAGLITSVRTLFGGEAVTDTGMREKAVVSSVTGCDNGVERILSSCHGLSLLPDPRCQCWMQCIVSGRQAASSDTT